MKETTTIACQPKPQVEGKDRFSQNFSTNQLPDTGHLKWHVLSKMEGDTDISFNVRQECSLEKIELRFKNISDGAITPYVAYRNLYISDVQNATGHFIVCVESC